MTTGEALLALACILTALVAAVLIEIARDWWGSRRAMQRELKRGRTHA